MKNLGYMNNNYYFNYRMNDIEAALGLSQIKRLDEIVKKRNDLKILLRGIKKSPSKSS